MLDLLHPFSEALKIHGDKVVLPTNLKTADLKKVLDAAVRRQSMYSAQTTITDLLDSYKDKISSLLNPTTEQRADRITAENPKGNVTEGLNPASARADIKGFFKSIGIQPSGANGTLTDITSDARINLVLKTNTELAQGAGSFIQQNDPDILDGFPALELYRQEGRSKVRDWEARWEAAAAEAGDTDAAAALQDSGRMVALKASPIWDSLGDGAGGFDDTLENPYPPFAFNSGMWTRNVTRADAEELGLIQPGQKAEAHPLDLKELFSPGN